MDRVVSLSITDELLDTFNRNTLLLQFLSLHNQEFLVQMQIQDRMLQVLGNILEFVRLSRNLRPSQPILPSQPITANSVPKLCQRLKKK